MTHDEITAAHTLLTKHILGFDPDVISPHTQAALNAAEDLARYAHNATAIEADF